MAARPLTTLDKSEVLPGLFAVWDSIIALLEGLSEPQWQATSPLPGWDVKAVVSHMIGTELFLAGIAVPQPDVDVTALDHVRNDIGVMNECWVRHFSDTPGANVFERFCVVTNDRRKALQNLPDDDWDAPTPTPAGLDTYGRFMRLRVFDCWMHEHDIRETLKRPLPDNEFAGPASQLALDEISATMGFVVGKLAKAPDGSRILFELTGPLARRIHVVVDGRAQVVDDFGGAEPSATVALDGLQFTRLTGGRPMSFARSPVIECGGDKDLASRIVECLNFVI